MNVNLFVMSLKYVLLCYDCSSYLEQGRGGRDSVETTLKFQDKAPNMCKPQTESARTVTSKCSVC